MDTELLQLLQAAMELAQSASPMTVFLIQMAIANEQQKPSAGPDEQPPSPINSLQPRSH